MELERRHLGYLAAVARHRSVTRAAEALGISQPALSRSIQDVERLLGVRCFDRLPQGVAPTAACLQVLRRAEDLLLGFEELEREAQRLGERLAGPLAVGLGPAVAASSAVRELARLLARHREVACSVVFASAPELMRRLQRHELDVFVADQAEIEPSDVELEREAIEYQAVLLARAGHPILRSAEPLREAARHPIAILSAPAAGIASLRALLREGDPGLAADWAPALVVDHAASLEAVVLDGDFLGGSVTYCHAEALRSGALRVVPLPRPIHSAHVGPVRLRERALSPAAEALWKAVCEALRRDLAAADEAETALG